jgi:hypothetical protein
MFRKPIKSNSCRTPKAPASFLKVCPGWNFAPLNRIKSRSRGESKTPKKLNQRKNKTMKNITKIIAAMLLFVAVHTHAQSGPVTAAQSLTVPTVAAGGVSNSIAQLVDCKQQNVALSWTTGSTNVVARFSASVDATYYHTNYYVLQLGCTTLGTEQTTITNLAVAGVRYLRLDSVTSTGTGNSTNTVSYGIKISAP